MREVRAEEIQIPILIELPLQSYQCRHGIWNMEHVYVQDIYTSSNHTRQQASNRKSAACKLPLVVAHVTISQDMRRHSSRHWIPVSTECVRLNCTVRSTQLSYADTKTRIPIAMSTSQRHFLCVQGSLETTVAHTVSPNDALRSVRLWAKLSDTLHVKNFFV